MAGTKTDGQRPAVGRSRTLAAAEGGLSCSQQLSQCLSIFMLLCNLVGFWVFVFFFVCWFWMVISVFVPLSEQFYLRSRNEEK